MPITRSTSSIASNSTHLLPQTQSNKKSLNATQARIKLFDLFTAFSSFLSENSTKMYEKLKSKVIKPVFVPSDHPSEATRLFVDSHMMAIRDVWMGDKDEKQVAKRLRALSKEDVLQDRDFANWSIYALTEVPGTHPKSQYKLKWLKDGEVHTSTIDVISKAPSVVTTDKAKRESLSTGVHAALIHKLGAKAIELSTMEECIKAFNKERYGNKNDAEQELEEAIEKEVPRETHCAVPDRPKPKKDQEKPEVESKETDDDEIDDEKTSVNEDNDDLLNLVDNEIEDHVYEVSPDDISDDSDDEKVMDTEESDSESNVVEDDLESESEQKKRDFIFTRSYMTLRLTEKERLEGKTRGKRVYFNPNPRYYNPKLKRDAPMKRYFPPAFKLPKNCK